MEEAELPDTIAARLKYARMLKGFSQGHLARLAGVDRDVIKKIENGKSERPREIKAIASALGVSAAWLQFGDTEVDSITKDGFELAIAWETLPEPQKSAMKLAILRMAGPGGAESEAAPEDSKKPQK